VITRTPEGGYVERHLPLSPSRAHAIATAEQSALLPADGSAQVDEPDDSYVLTSRED
jgi:hypothetical protein